MATGMPSGGTAAAENSDYHKTHSKGAQLHAHRVLLLRERERERERTRERDQGGRVEVVAYMEGNKGRRFIGNVMYPVDIYYPGLDSEFFIFIWGSLSLELPQRRGQDCAGDSNL